MNHVLNAMEITWQDVDKLPKEKTIVFVTIAPVEEHGKHLPLGVDIYEGEKWSEEAINSLKEKLPDYYFLRLPYLPIAYGEIKGFPFTFHYKQNTVRQVTYELLQTVVKSGFKNIVVISSHGDPRHQNAIEEACQKINKRYGMVAFSPMGAYFSYKELKIDINLEKQILEKQRQYPQDYHAGWLETSCMLDIKPALVKNIFKDIEGIKIEIKDFFHPDKLSQEIAGEGHIGFPDQADKHLGRLINQNVSRYLCDAIIAFVNRTGFKKYQHGIYFRIPFLKTNFKRNLIIAFISLTGGAVFLITLFFK